MVLDGFSLWNHWLPAILVCLDALGSTNLMDAVRVERVMCFFTCQTSAVRSSRSSPKRRTEAEKDEKVAMGSWDLIHLGGIKPHELSGEISVSVCHRSRRETGRSREF